MSAEIRLTDEGNSLRITLGTFIKDILKGSDVSFDIIGNNLFINVNHERLKIPFGSVVDPIVANVDALRDFLVDTAKTSIGTLTSTTITQTLNAGDNTINHAVGKTIIFFQVKDGNDFVAVSGNIIDSDNFNINLAAGSITNATITVIYSA